MGYNKHVVLSNHFNSQIQPTHCRQHSIERDGDAIRQQKHSFPRRCHALQPEAVKIRSPKRGMPLQPAEDQQVGLLRRQKPEEEKNLEQQRKNKDQKKANPSVENPRGHGSEIYGRNREETSIPLKLKARGKSRTETEQAFLDPGIESWILEDGNIVR